MLVGCWQLNDTGGGGKRNEQSRGYQPQGAKCGGRGQFIGVVTAVLGVAECDDIGIQVSD